MAETDKERIKRLELKLKELQSEFDIYRALTIHRSLENSDIEYEVIKNFARELTEQYKNNSNEISGTDCEEAWLGDIILEYYGKLLAFREEKRIKNNDQTWNSVIIVTWLILAYKSHMSSIFYI